MRGFQYKHGDRPLEGYTIQRAAGRGGFGEVYYAVSDSGREVALKVVHTYEQIELRGISQCMNLKSPHLVSIFDVKHAEDGRPWVIMEFVSGPSLRELLDAAPPGLGTQKAAFFLREIGKGLTYLHDCGIVHRDLKPGNIFFENGYVKIGDYGLSKAITASQHSGQTVTVGTVHYMAPEIGVGKYDRGIDIYALGALLYEMIKGTVPFFGASAGEVLMKHMSAEVGVEGIEEPFATVIKKAMAKDPAQRYQSVQEMVEAVFGSEHVQQSVSTFSPDSLSMVAARVARHVGSPVTAGAGGSSGPTVAPGAGVLGGAAADSGHWPGVGGFAERVGGRIANLGARAGAAGTRLLAAAAPAVSSGPGGPPGGAGAGTQPGGEAVMPDPLGAAQRKALILVTLAIAALISGATGGPALSLFAFLAGAGATLGVLIARNKLLAPLKNESPFLQRLAVGGVGAACALVVSLPVWVPTAVVNPRLGVGFLGLAVIVGLFLTDWEARAGERRKERVSTSGLWNTAFLGLVLGAIFGGNVLFVIGVLCGTSLAVQVASPWTRVHRRPARGGAPPPVPPPVRSAADAVGPDAPTLAAGWAGADAPVAAPNQVPPPPPPAAAGGPPPFPASPARFAPPTWSPYAGRRVPKPVRGLWLVLFVGLACLGIMLLLWPMFDNIRSDDAALSIGFGMGSLAGAGFCLLRSFQRRFDSWWKYLLRPAIVLCCVQSMLVSFWMLVAGGLRRDEPLIALFFIIFPALLLLAITLLPKLWARAPGDEPPAPAGRDRTGAAAGASSILRIDVAKGLAKRVFLFALAALGVFLLVDAFLVALAAAVDVPGLVASGLMDQRLADQLRRDFGDGDWHVIGRGLFTAGALVLALLATLALMAARRGSGSHMLRAVLGAALLMGSTFVLRQGLPAWRDIPPPVVSNEAPPPVPPRAIEPGVIEPPPQWGPRRARSADGQRAVAVVRAYLDGVNQNHAIWAGSWVLAAAVLLFWPSAERRGSRRRWDWHDHAAKPAAAEGGAA